MKKYVRNSITGLLLLLPFTISTITLAKKIDFTQRTDVANFIQSMVKNYGFDANDLTQLLSKVKLNPDVIARITTPFETKPWYVYRTFFVTPDRIKQGVAYWRKHQATLAKAEREYGVPAPIIIAILGIESRYGKERRKYSALDALSTLAFDYPPRAPFFRQELVEYLLLSREQQFDPTKIKSSYAGAIGQPQFMPDSYRNYAVDFTGKGHKDLDNNTDDVIASVANYFKQHGWQPGETIAVPAIIKQNHFQSLVKDNFKPRYDFAELKRHGLEPRVKPQKSFRASVFSLDGYHQTEYWLGYNNFYVITRYNSSKLYAMTVLELSQEIAKLYKSKRSV